MRIMHVSWEYPPVIYGGLGVHVHALAEEQARQGHHVTVLTQSLTGEAHRANQHGVDVIAVSPPTRDRPREPTELVEWITELDYTLSEAAPGVVAELRPDIVHAHDWVVSRAAGSACTAGDIPLVTTIHATEAGRHQGWIHGSVSTEIHRREFNLTNNSARVIACSQRMRSDVAVLFDIAEQDIDVIPNGIALTDWMVPQEDLEVARQRWSPHEDLIVFVGRLEWEKGVQTLIEAVTKLTDRNVHLVIAGTGSYETVLVEQARDLIESERITVTGWLPRPDLMALQAAADVIVVPSLYEPFGLVALEAGALGVPVVVADTGGLSDVVDGGAAGLMFTPADANSLAQAIGHALDDRAATIHRTASMNERLRSIYRWDAIVQQTVRTYETAIGDHSRTPRTVCDTYPAIPDTNLLRQP